MDALVSCIDPEAEEMQIAHQHSDEHAMMSSFLTHVPTDGLYENALVYHIGPEDVEMQLAYPNVLLDRRATTSAAAARTSSSPLQSHGLLALHGARRVDNGY